MPGNQAGHGTIRAGRITKRSRFPDRRPSRTCCVLIGKRASNEVGSWGGLPPHPPTAKIRTWGVIPPPRSERAGGRPPQRYQKNRAPTHFREALHTAVHAGTSTGSHSTTPPDPGGLLTFAEGGLPPHPPTVKIRTWGVIPPPRSERAGGGPPRSGTGPGMAVRGSGRRYAGGFWENGGREIIPRSIF
jgi:hypothetical protein